MNSLSISVIVPVYNVEKYLPRCINSILAQTFTNFELLLIDDGSKDKSGAICDDYAKKYPRVKVFHKDNGGVSSARNMGLDNAKGEWICFCDSDDYLESDYLEKLYMPMLTNSKSLVIGGYKSCEESNVKVLSVAKQNKQISLTLEQFIELDNINIFNYCWGKLFSRRILIENSLRFSIHYSYGEDKLFVLKYILCVSYMYLSPSCSYIYINKENGLSKKIYSYDIILKWKEEVIHIMKEIKDQKGYKDIFLHQIIGPFDLYFVLYSLNSLFLSKTKNKKKILSNIYKTNTYISCTSSMGIRKKIGILLYRFNHPFLSFIIYSIIYRMHYKLI